MKNRLLFFIFTLTIISIAELGGSEWFAGVAKAAPDPLTVEKVKSDSPLHVEGEVVSDYFYRDQTKKSSYPSQIRIMVLKINKIMKKNRNQYLNPFCTSFLETNT